MATKSNTPDTTGPDSGEPTTSTSAQDASTTEGAKAAGVNVPQPTPSSAGGAATAQQGGVQRVQIEQAPADPDVQYPGDPDATNPDRPHVKAEYEAFTW
jgi:hypothetical protein